MGADASDASCCYGSRNESRVTKPRRQKPANTPQQELPHGDALDSTAAPEIDSAKSHVTKYRRPKPDHMPQQELPATSPPSTSRQTCVISKAEERGISLPQMNDVYDLIKQHSSRWLDWHGNQLQFPAEAMNLYHTADNLIKPSTEEPQCSFVETIATGSQMPLVGRIFQQHSYLHHCTFQAAQVIQITVHLLDLRANNQWKLDTEIQADPSETSFYCALRASVGVLMVLDPQGKVATRVWCCYEVGSALDMHQQGKKFEMATVLPDGSAVVISDGVTAEDKEQGKELQWEHIGAADAHKARREQRFPIEIAEKLLSTLLQNGQASVEEDRVRILNSLTGQPLDAVPLTEHPSYDALNTKLHFRVGMAVYEAAAAAKSLDRLGLRELAAPEGWDVGILYYWLGEAFRQQHKLDLAVDLLEKALSHREAMLGKTHKDTLYAAFRLARALSFKGELDRALELYEELALAVKEGLGEQSYEYTNTLNTMGHLYCKRGDLDRAVELLEQSADIIKEVHGEWSKSYGVNVGNRARVLMRKGDHSRALPMLQQARAILEETCGRQHPFCGKAARDIGGCHEAQGEQDQALEAYAHAREVFQAAFGEGSMQCARVHAKSASVHIKKGELDCALQLLQGAPPVLEAALGKQDELFCFAALRLSVVHQKKGELGNAQHWLSEATAEFDLKSAVVQAVQLWATALGHLAHKQVQQAVGILQQVALDFDAVALEDSRYSDFAKFVRELAVQFSSCSLAVGVEAEAQHE